MPDKYPRSQTAIKKKIRETIKELEEDKEGNDGSYYPIDEYRFQAKTTRRLLFLYKMLLNI